VTAIKAYIFRKRLKLLILQKRRQEAMMNAVIAEQEARSESSKRVDPVLAPDIFNFKTIIKKAMFKSNVDPQFWFYYQILSDGKPLNLGKNANISWSLFIKKGKKCVPVW
jgi:hypothetical protein